MYAIVKLTHFTPVSCLEVRNFWVYESDGLLILMMRPDPPGYAFGLIIEARTKHQERNKPTQGDPVQLSAHFLVGAGLVLYEVHVRTLKSGRSYTHLCAEFFQEVNHSSRIL